MRIRPWRYLSFGGYVVQNYYQLIKRSDHCPRGNPDFGAVMKHLLPSFGLSCGEKMPLGDSPAFPDSRWTTLIEGRVLSSSRSEKTLFQLRLTGCSEDHLLTICAKTSPA
jgi:hypothetical protein